MRIKYLAADYEQRLHGGVIMWNGVPHVVKSLGDGNVSIHNVFDNTRIANDVDPLDERLDIASPELGYINGDGSAIYMERIPARRYRQSLDDRALIEYELSKAGILRLNNDGRSRYLYTKLFRDSYSKPYPTFNAARKTLALGDIRSVALSRNVAMFIDEMGILKIFYKLEMVGWVAPGETIVKVPSSDKGWVISMHLQELGWEVE